MNYEFLNEKLIMTGIATQTNNSIDVIKFDLRTFTLKYVNTNYHKIDKLR